MADITQETWQAQLDWLEQKLRPNIPHASSIAAEALLAAWPSSPQGLAVKQVMEALVAYTEGEDYGRHTVSCQVDKGEECSCGMRPLLATLDAARKAGLDKVG